MISGVLNDIINPWVVLLISGTLFFLTNLIIRLTGRHRPRPLPAQESL